MFSNDFDYSLQVKSEIAPVQVALQTNFWFEEIFAINPFEPKLNLSGLIDKHILFNKDCHDKNFNHDLSSKR